MSDISAAKIIDHLRPIMRQSDTAQHPPGVRLLIEELMLYFCVFTRHRHRPSLDFVILKFAVDHVRLLIYSPYHADFGAPPLRTETSAPYCSARSPRRWRPWPSPASNIHCHPGRCYR